MAQEYASLEVFKARLVNFNNVTPEQEDDLADILEAASRAVDDYVKVTPGFFMPPSAASSKVLRGRGNTFIELPMPLYGSVTVTAPTNITAPNFTVEDMRLVTLDDDDAPSSFIVWEQDVYYTVNGNWGYPTIPAQIREACLQIAVHFYRGRDKSLTGTIADMRSDAAFPERDYPKQTRRLLDEFKTNLGGEPGGNIFIV